MRILHIAYYVFKKEFKSCVPQMIFLPLILILILGNSLNIMHEGNIKFNECVVVYSSSDKEFQAIDGFLKKNGDFSKEIKLVRVKQRKEAVEGLKEGQYNGFIEIKNKGNIKLYIDSEKNADESLITTFINAYNFSGNTIINDNSIKSVKITSNKRINSAINYYSVTMLIMIILYSAEYGIGLISEEEEIINRTAGLPVKREKIIIGKMLGVIMMMFLVVVIIIAISRVFYKAYWGENYVSLMFPIILFSFLAVNFGMATCLIVRDGATASYIIQTFAIIFTLLGGGYIPTSFFSQGLRKMSIFSPSYAEQNIVFKIIYGYGQNIGLFYLELIALATLLFGISMLLTRRRTR
ncbi:ABC transporter permease [Clostridium neuense]|uniref:ABC transporter permease n=1 Tax=Clostridium neuense TaxID=1728934 RepID=A0ABW8TD86_9CLOT